MVNDNNQSRQDTDCRNWDWDEGKRLIAETGNWMEQFEWIEDFKVSPDGENIASVVKTGDMEFSVCVNGETWENAFDKIYLLKFGPDGRLTGLVSDTGEWTVATDGETWESRFDFVWDLKTDKTGKSIAVSAQQGMQYLAALNDVCWENLYSNMTHMVLSDDGTKTAGVVQSVEIKTADILQFQQGCYSIAVDGEVWDKNFTNLWEISFNADSSRVAAEGRLNLYDYTIFVDGKPWNEVFNCIWRPKFDPKSGSVTAPARISGKWTLVKDGKPFWKSRFDQLWHHTYSPDGANIAAIVAKEYGRWTIAANDSVWGFTFGDLVTDLVFSPDGKSIAALGKENEKWTVIVDGKPWNGVYDMVWAPVFSPDGKNVAVRAEKNGVYTVLVNGIPFKETFSQVFDPVFSPDGKSILIKGITGGKKEGQYYREVYPLAKILG